MISLVYYFFPHYREPVIRELSSRFGERMEFVSSDVDHLDGIRTTKFWKEVRHTKVALHRSGKFLVTPGLISHCLRSNNRYFVFLAHPYAPDLWVALLLLKLRRKRILLWTHGWTKRGGRWDSLLKLLFFSFGDVLLFYSDRAAVIARESGIPDARIKVIYNSVGPPVDVRRLSPFALSPQGVVVFGFIGRLTALVGLDLLFEAAAILSSRGIECRCVVVGDGPMESSYREAASKLGVQVDFLGAIYQDAALATFFSQIVALVSPGKVGLAAMHALAHGRPVITHDDLDWQMPEAEAIVPGVNGAFFQRGDSTSLASAMQIVVDLVRRGSITPQKCCDIINEKYNSVSQANRIVEALDGVG